MNKKLLLGIIIVIVIVTASIFAVRFFSRSSKVPITDIKSVAVEQKKFEAINGSFVSEELARQRPLAVIVENHPDSRPQSGLTKADIVYEALAEGGITRYLALYQSNSAEHIGPVRSARDYYASIANTWGALFAHVGGSPEVLEELAEGQYPRVTDVNEFYNATFFERIKSRFAPHNVYTSTNTLYSFLKDSTAWQKPIEPLFVFKNSDAGNITNQQTFSAHTISLDFSTAPFRVRFEYNAATGVYHRFVAGEKDIDAASKEQVSPKTIVVQLVDVTAVANDPALRVDVRLSGQGKALVFMDGQVIDGTWQKTANGKTMFMDTSGQEIALNRGQLWIALVPTTKAAELYWQSATVNADGSMVAPMN